MKKGSRRKHVLMGRPRLLLFVLCLLLFAWGGPLQADDDAEFMPDQVVVKLNPASGATIAAINTSYGTITLDTLLGSAGIYLLQIGAGQDVETVVDAMLDDPRLLYAEPNFIGDMPEGDPSGTWAWGGYDPNAYLDQYAAALLNLPSAHTISQGAGIIVAVLDTGVQLSHPRLAGQIAAAGYDFIEDDTNPDDSFNGLDDDADGLVDEGTGHGTHVAGIVNLVAPAAQIMPLRVLDSDGRGNDFMIAEAIQFARAHGATVINLSLGTPAESELLAEIMAEAVAAGVVMVAAAGNLDSNTEQFPAAYPGALAVTAVGPDSRKSPFANYGAWVDIAAPGTSITSTFPIDGYAQWSGTSMATGFVSGQAALLQSTLPDLTVAYATWLIQTTAQPLDAANPSYAGQLGSGLADVGGSLSLAAGADCGSTLTLPAQADAWIEQNSPSNNKGDDSILKVKTQGGSDNFRLLLRFGLPATIPAGCVVEEATLRLYAPSWTGGRTLQALRLTGNWSEMGVTWGNQPGTTGAAATALSGSGYREWDVAAQLQGMWDAAAPHGFLIRDASEGGSGAEQQFHSREQNENPPQLVIQFGPGTTPGPLPFNTTITTGPAAATTSSSATFTFTATGSASTFTCSLDGAAFTPCTSPHLLSNLAIGQHIWAVRATDAAGNPDPTPATFTWTVTPPLPPLTASCGQVIVTSGLLLNDLTDCPGDGLIVGANGITLDLNGHTVDGVGLGVGIRNDGFDGVTISHGTVQEFDVGVQLNSGTAFNTLTTLTVQLNQVVGIELLDADDGSNGNSLVANIVTGNSGGIWLDNGTSGTTITQNILSDNANFALSLLSSSHNTIEGNLITGSSDTAILFEDASYNVVRGNTLYESADGALTLQLGSNFNRLENNHISTGSDAGVTLADSMGNELLANTIHNMGDAAILLVNAHDNRVQGNDLRGNATGIELDGSTGNHLTANNASHSGGAGITLENNALGNVLNLNAVNFNAAAGITIAAEVQPDSPFPGNIVAYNTATGNQDDGFAIHKAGHTLIGNTAKNNAGWGIYAELGTINGGANVASGNIESQQCFNFACTGSATLPPDTTPPETTLDSGPAAATSDSFATFTFSSNETGATFACSLDGATFTACATPLTVTGVGLGSHTLSVRAIDLAENADATPASFTWTVEPPLDCGPPVTVVANADAWIEQNSPVNNKGDDSILKVKAQGNNDNFRTLVRFALPTTVPAGCVVESATLRLYASSWRTGRTLQAYRLAASWAEMGVTWGNQPAVTGAAATTSSGSGYRQWQVTTQVQAMWSSGLNHGFLIRDANESGSGREQAFHSHEHSTNPPQLILTFVPASP